MLCQSVDYIKELDNQVNYFSNKRIYNGINRSDLLSDLLQKKALKIKYIQEKIRDDKDLTLLVWLFGKYFIKDIHREMIDYQFSHKKSLQLVYRGFGKTTICTEFSTVVRVINNPDITIVLVSKTHNMAKRFLSGIKNKLKSDIIQILYGDLQGDVWSETKITVKGRTSAEREKTVETVGYGMGVVGGHYDMGFIDDVVDNKNSCTELQREQLKNWYYTILDPCFSKPHTEVHILGTRYHPEDLYNHWIEHEYKDYTNILQGLVCENENGDPLPEKMWYSRFPEKHPVEWFKQKRINAGSIIFDCQYRLKTDKMNGSVFRWDWLQNFYEVAPKKLWKFLGVDPSTGDNSESDLFAICVIGFDPDNDDAYLLDFYVNRIPFTEQCRKIKEFYTKHEAVCVGIESNACEKYVRQALSEMYSDILIRDVNTDTDKIRRAVKLSPKFENKKVFFKKNMLTNFIPYLVRFPKGKKDLFDAMDHAFSARAFFNLKLASVDNESDNYGIIQGRVK